MDYVEPGGCFMTSTPLQTNKRTKKGRAGYGGSLDGTWPYVYEEVGDLSVTSQPRLTHFCDQSVILEP